MTSNTNTENNLHLHVDGKDRETGEAFSLEGDSVETLAHAYRDSGLDCGALEVRDAHGFTRGWIRADGTWTAQ